MAEGMNQLEQLQMMRRCRDEIQALRHRLNFLEPRAEAYETITTLVRYLAPRTGQGAGEDVVWILEKRMREIEAAAEKAQESQKEE